MPVTNLPASFKIVELQLAIQVAGEAPMRPLNKKRAPFSGLTERWQGQIAFAAVNRNDALAQAAALEAVDGRVTVFGVPLKQGFATHANGLVGTLAAAGVAGADRISVNVTGGTLTTLKRGTLLQLGSPGDAGYQMIEVMQDCEVRAASPVLIAPRLRTAIASGTAVTGGDVTACLRLTGDSVDLSFSIDRGVAVLDVIEAIL